MTERKPRMTIVERFAGLPIREKIAGMRAMREKGREVRAIIGLADVIYDDDYIGFTASEIAEELIDDVNRGVAHWYEDVGLSKAEFLSRLEPFRE